MQNLSALLLVATGLAIGAGMYGPKSDTATATLAEVTQISTAPDSDSSRVAVVPGLPGRQTPPDLARSADRDTSIATNTKPAPPQPWSTVVTADASAVGAQKLTSSRPGDAMTRAELARDLQRELTRVGCYGGEINGGWTTSTRRAMSAFVDRVNASLPVSEPDYILLSLVRNHAGVACSNQCGQGEVMTAGRCVPETVALKDERAAQKRAKLAAAEAAKRDSDRMVEEQRVATLSRAAEKAAARERETAAQTARNTAPTPIAKAPEILPWQQATVIDAPKPATPPAARPDGIMSLGMASGRTATIAAETLPPLAGPASDVANDPIRSIIASVTPEPDPLAVERDEAASLAASDAEATQSRAEAIAQLREPRRAARPVASVSRARNSAVASKPRARTRSVRHVRRTSPRYYVQRSRPRTYYASSGYYGGYSRAYRTPRGGMHRFNLMRAIGSIF